MYLSRRSGSSKEKIHTSKDLVDMQYFKEVLNKAGITLQYSDNPNVYSKESSLLRRDLQKELDTHENYPNNLPEFITGLKHLYSENNKKKYLKKALMPSVLNDFENCSISKQQDCLFRLLLGIDCVQTEVMSLLLQEAVTHVVEEPPESEDTGWLRLILGPLRYLPQVKEPGKLREQALELLEVGTYSAQVEILSHLPEMLPDSQYEESAPHLVRLMDQTNDLVPAVIGCLCCLRLPSHLKEQLQDKILAIMCTSSSLKTFPMILNFLVTGCRPANLLTVLGRTRSAIHAVMVGTEISDDVERETHQLLTFQELHKLTCGNARFISDGWIQVISGVQALEDHYPVDILILLMLHGTDRGHKHSVEALVKKKTRTGQFKPEFIQNTLNKYLVPQIYNDYLSSIVSLANSLSQAGNDFAYISMSRAFYLGAFFWKRADAPCRQEVLESLMLWGSGGAEAALGTLQAIASAPRGTNLLKPHSLLLTLLIDKLDMINLAETNLLFDFLGSVLWPLNEVESDSTQNYVLVIIRKQLISAKQVYRYRGVVTGVAVVRHMVQTSADQDSSRDLSYSSVWELPAGRVREAAQLLQLADESTRHWPTGRAFFLDQLAHMVANSESLDPHFIAWLVDAMTADFQDFCVVNKLPEMHHDPPFFLLYNINESEAVNENIMINIAGQIVEKSEEAALELVILSPMFRLVRLLHQKQQDGSLGSIDALLGCGIIMLQTDWENLEANHQAVRKLLDCTFHAINWLRELVSAFVTQKDKSIRNKVISRITTLIELEENIRTLLRHLPSNSRHRFPVVHYYGAEFNVKNIGLNEVVKGKVKRTHDGNETTKSSSQGNSQTQTIKSTRLNIKEKDILQISYREMDTDIMLLLKHHLTFEKPTTHDITLTIQQFKFIIGDLIRKLQILLKPTSLSTLSHFNQAIKADDLIKDLVHLMPSLEHHLTDITQQLKLLLEKCDGIYDSHEMFQKETNDIKISFGSILELISLILSWSGFQNSSNLPLLRDLLRSLVNEESTQMRSTQQLSLAFINKVIAISEQCLTLQSAVCCVTIIKVLCNIVLDKAPLVKKLIGLSGKLLEKKWYTLEGLSESGATASVNINILVKSHLQGSDLSTVNSIVFWVHTEVPNLTNKDDHLSTFQCLNKINFSILYRAICSTLHEALHTELNRGKNNTEHLTIWKTTAETLHGIMDIVRIQENRSNLNSFLKKSTGILRLFLSHGLPIFEILLKSNSEKVTEILKKMQISTRFLHNLCCHSKVTKDRSLVSLVPQMRQVLETLVYRVKALLAANNCSNVFWMGNLKNKDLQGEEIASQTTSTTENGEEETLPPEEEELPPDSDDNEEQSSDIIKSSSEVYN